MAQILEFKRNEKTDQAKQQERQYWETLLNCWRGLTERDCREIFGIYNAPHYIQIEFMLKKRIEEANWKKDNEF